MNKLFLIPSFLLVFQVSAQDATLEFSPIKSPNASSFLNVNYLPLNESTGRANVNIPLYTLDLDGMSIPLSLTYDTGGVKVNSVASTVGLNWSLNGGGIVSKEVQGYGDTTSTTIPSDYSLTGYVFNRFGFLSALTNQAVDAPIIKGYEDTQPDLFYVKAAGLETKFVHKSNGDPYELSNTGSIIKSSFQEITSPFTFNKRGFEEDFKFEITTANGFIYTFNEREYVYHNSVNRSQNDLSFPITDDLERTIWPTDYTEQQLLAEIKNPWDFAEQLLFPVIHISSIKNPVSKRSINYYYEDNLIIDNNRRIERSLSGIGIISQTNFEHDLTKEKLLSKIVSPNCVINFYYTNNRLDVRGGKVLNKIEVRNNFGELIKGIVFEQDYITSVENCSDHNCYRLRLNAIKFIDKDNNVLPGYIFQYSPGKLPKRFSVDQDYMGYYNGPSGIPEAQYFPKSYFKQGQGKNSIIPFPFTGYSLMPGGNANKIPNLTYAKAASLEKITYPTGGYTVFNYELHDFSFNNTSVQCGGLRLKSQALYDSNNALQKNETYEYKEINNISSGSIINLPKFVNEKTVDNIYSTTVSKQVSNTILELTNGAFVIYGRVKRYEQNKGYTINEYTDSNDFPNFTPTGYSLYGTSIAPSWFLENISNGLTPSVFQDFSEKRGQLISSRTFDNSNNLLEEVINEYEHSIYDSFDIKNHIILKRATYFSNNTQYAIFSLSLPSENYHLKRTIINHSSTSGSLTEEKNYLYVTDKPFIKEEQYILNNTDTRREVIYYPFDSQVSSLPNIYKLNSLNIIIPIKRQYFSNNILLSTSTSSFNDFGANKILQSQEGISKGKNTVEVRVNYKKYDKRGNLIEFQKQDGTLISTLWAYDYQYKIAEVINASYDDILTALNNSDSNYLQTKNNDELELELTKLRNNLPAAQVYSYIHNPLVGVLSITDPKGNKNTYEYDNFKRLIRIKDNAGKILTESNYNYKVSPSINLPTQKPLTISILKSNTPDYLPSAAPSIQSTLLSAMTSGGRGDYKYEWKLNGSSTVLSREYKYIAEVSCNMSRTYTVKVTDSNGTSITTAVSVNAPNCGEAFYVGLIEGQSSTNNQNNFWVSAAEGGGFRVFSYQWYIVGKNSPGDPLVYTNIYPNSSSLLRNTSGKPVTVNLGVKVTDLSTGFFIIRTKEVVIQPEFEISSCFIAGTTITMADGSEKNIEDIVIGDEVLTYNIDNKQLEVGSVLSLVNPKHKRLVRLNFANGTQNTSTPDHPYYIKDKGWSSFDPDLTRTNYKLDVNKLVKGDMVFLYNSKEKNLELLKIIEHKIIDEEQTTYNLDKVSKNHNFFANGILVHNKSSLRSQN